ncbi:MAG: hypothetical protein H7069_14525 [Phormidesmis sp. FL-bin-119]|nr:hypothetical protein [Pedobacter sp.]
MNHKSILLLAIISLMGCSNLKQSLYNGPLFNKFPSAETVKGKKYMTLANAVPRRLFIYKDQLITANRSETEDHLFSFYELATKKLIKHQIGFGTHFGEVMSPLSIGLIKNKLWSHDITANKIVAIDLDSKEKVKQVEEFKLLDMVYSLQLKDSLIYYTSGHSKLNSKVQSFSIRNNMLLDQFGKYDNVPENIPLSAWKTANESFLFMKPDGTKLVSALRFADQLEFFDLASKTSKVIKGPENIELRFDVFKHEGIDIGTRNDETRFGFLNGFATNRFIYLLYSGQLEVGKNFKYGKYIYVYAWDGRPIKKISLPNFASCITIVNDNELYWFDVNTNAVMNAPIHVL